MWDMVNLFELCGINIGKTPPRSDPKCWGTGLKWLSISDMKSKFLSNTSEQITVLAVDKCNMKLIPKGTVVMSFKLSIGKVGIIEEDMYSNEAIANFPIKDYKRLTENYLFYALQAIDLLKNTDKAVKGLTLNKEKMKQIEIPLPPLEIQNKISDTLDNITDLIDKRKQQIELMDKLAKDAFIEMFGDPIINAKEWELKTLKDSAKVVTGNTPPRANSEYYGAFIDWIKSDNINTPNMYITKSAEMLSEEGYKKGRIVPENSILMTCIAGSHNCIGNIAITDKPVAFNQQINAIVLGELPVLFWYMQLLLLKQKVQDLSTKGMKGIVNKTKLESLTVIFPPIDLQIKFSEQLKIIEEQKSCFEASLRELETTYKATMQKAFNAEIFN